MNVFIFIFLLISINICAAELPKDLRKSIAKNYKKTHNVNLELLLNTSDHHEKNRVRLSSLEHFAKDILELAWEQNLSLNRNPARSDSAILAITTAPRAGFITLRFFSSTKIFEIDPFSSDVKNYRLSRDSRFNSVTTQYSFVYYSVDYKIVEGKIVIKSLSKPETYEDKTCNQPKKKKRSVEDSHESPKKLKSSSNTNAVENLNIWPYPTNNNNLQNQMPNYVGIQQNNPNQNPFVNNFIHQSNDFIPVQHQMNSTFSYQNHFDPNQVANNYLQQQNTFMQMHYGANTNMPTQNPIFFNLQQQDNSLIPINNFGLGDDTNGTIFTDEQVIFEEPTANYHMGPSGYVQPPIKQDGSEEFPFIINETDSVNNDKSVQNNFTKTENFSP